MSYAIIYNGLHREVPTESGLVPFSLGFRHSVYQRGGNSQVEDVKEK